MAGINSFIKMRFFLTSSSSFLSSTPSFLRKQESTKIAIYAGFLLAQE